MILHCCCLYCCFVDELYVQFDPYVRCNPVRLFRTFEIQLTDHLLTKEFALLHLCFKIWSTIHLSFLSTSCDRLYPTMLAVVKNNNTVWLYGRKTEHLSAFADAVILV